MGLIRRPRRMARLLLVSIASCWGVAGAETTAIAETEAVLSQVDRNIQINLPLETSHEVRFKQEPDYKGHDIVRSSIPLGKKREDFVGFAWDRDDHLLYVDLDRDLNLDDEKAIAQANGAFGFGDTFEINLLIDRQGIAIPYTLSVSFMNEWFSFGNVTSGWEGKVALGGREFNLRYADNLDAVFGDGDLFTLTPSDSENETETETIQSAAGVTMVVPGESVDFGVPRYLVVGESLHAVDMAFRAAPDGAQVVVQLSKPTVAVGEISLTGKYIQEIALSNGNSSVLAYPSGAVLPAPVGHYRVARLIKDGGWKLTFPNLWSADVRDDRSSTLDVGGALKESIVVAPIGNTLSLQYAVTGAGGEAYTGPTDYLNPPRFAVYRGDTRVAAGQFEYG